MAGSFNKRWKHARNTHGGHGLLGQIVQFLESFVAAMEVGAGDDSVGNSVLLHVALASDSD